MDLNHSLPFLTPCHHVLFLQYIFTMVRNSDSHSPSQATTVAPFGRCAVPWLPRSRVPLELLVVHSSAICHCSCLLKKSTSFFPPPFFIFFFNTLTRREEKTLNHQKLNNNNNGPTVSLTIQTQSAAQSLRKYHWGKAKFSWHVGFECVYRLCFVLLFCSRFNTLFRWENNSWGVSLTQKDFTMACQNLSASCQCNF